MPDVKEFDMAVFAQRFRQIRMERGLSQSRLARTMGISASTLSWLERERHAPGAYVIYQTARFFQVSADWLLGLTDEREEKQWN